MDPVLQLKMGYELGQRWAEENVEGKGLKQAFKEAFIDTDYVLAVGVGAIIVGMIILVLAYVSPEITSAVNQANDTQFASIWDNFKGKLTTVFTFVAIGLIIGAVVYILRLVIRGFNF